MRYYIVTHDCQGGEFGMYRAYTAAEWSGQAKDWCDCDEDEVLETWDLSNYDCEDALICDIEEWWEIVIKEITEEQKIKYEELLRQIDLNEHSSIYEHGSKEELDKIRDERHNLYNELDKLYENAKEVHYKPPKFKRSLNSLTGLIISIKDDKLEVSESGWGSAYSAYTFKGTKDNIKECVDKFLEDNFKEG